MESNADIFVVGEPLYLIVDGNGNDHWVTEEQRDKILAENGLVYNYDEETGRVTVTGISKGKT